MNANGTKKVGHRLEGVYLQIRRRYVGRFQASSAHVRENGINVPILQLVTEQPVDSVQQSI